MNVSNLEIPRTAIAYLPAQGSQSTGKLHIAWGYHMQEAPANETHAWGELNLANFQRQGDWHLADLPFYNQNMSTNGLYERYPCCLGNSPYPGNAPGHWTLSGWRLGG